MATLTAYAYDTAGNIGVAFGLQNLQFVRDGEERFDGRTNAADDFDVIDDPDASIDGDVSISEDESLESLI
jgi:hypothetical protein